MRQEEEKKTKQAFQFSECKKLSSDKPVLRLMPVLQHQIPLWFQISFYLE